MRSEQKPGFHAAWLAPEAFRAVGARRVAVVGDGPLVETVRREVEEATARFGGTVGTLGTVGADNDAELVLALKPAPDQSRSDAESFELSRQNGVTTLLADGAAGLLYGFFHVVRLGEAAFAADRPVERHQPTMRLRMVDHWDNVAIHDVMGQVERGYAGGSIFWDDGALRADLTRVRAYGRLLAAVGVNAVSVNNVNVHAAEAQLLTSRLDDVAALAEQLRPYGVRVHLSVSFASPILLGGLPTADPHDPAVGQWWADATRRVYERIPDFGGYVVKADSEGQPGPFAYGRCHADGANVLADALAPHGGVVHWRAFVYNHRQDWRDRSTDRARAAHDHFASLDGHFRGNTILQVKHGPIDFQPREPVSPVLAAMPRTRLAVELQATQEYTGQQRHVCYLAPMWREVLDFEPWGKGEATIADVAGGLVAVSNVGDDYFWTGHPLAQANLYAFGRLAWDPTLEPAAILDEWIGLTFPRGPGGVPDRLRHILHSVMDDSWRTYERYTAPLGVGFMVNPAGHYGPGIDGYEYTQWGTYHFADRDGIGVDRSLATGTGFAAQYPEPWSRVYESVDQCPDELLLFFHHVRYDHVLHSGSTVIQHIYDTHFAGVEQVQQTRLLWSELADACLLDPEVHRRVAERLDEQLRCAHEWRDQVNTYFFRKSGIPDARGRTIY
ncbi:MAG: alpha-glucuronidase [Catenulispora sp.]|nr:alpha-glucuronidase [Catenulispora sp.]